MTAAFLRIDTAEVGIRQAGEGTPIHCWGIQLTKPVKPDAGVPNVRSLRQQRPSKLALYHKIILICLRRAEPRVERVHVWLRDEFPPAQIDGPRIGSIAKRVCKAAVGLLNLTGAHHLRYGKRLHKRKSRKGVGVRLVVEKPGPAANRSA